VAQAAGTAKLRQSGEFGRVAGCRSSHGTQQNHHTPQITQPARPITPNAATRCRAASDHKASEGLRMIDRR
jgi:hypothetical protein